MLNKKIMKKVLSEEGTNPRYINNKSPLINNDKDKMPILERLKKLEQQINYIYRSLEKFTPALKVAPIITLIYDDAEKCRKRNVAIYNNWTKYFTHLSKYNASLKFIDIFNLIDKFIFDDFFQNSKRTIRVYSLDEKNASSVNQILSQDRYSHNYYKLKQPEDKEYISFLINDEDASINLYFFPREFINESSSSGNNNNEEEDINNTHIQLLKSPRIPTFTSNDNIVDDNLNNVINVNIKNDQFICSDKRFVVLGAQKPLFNTTVNTDAMNLFNNASYGVGPGVINISLIIFHGMVHLKCELEKKRIIKFTMKSF